jgi:probable biosynthetic protein (TIGR04098 family)
MSEETTLQQKIVVNMPQMALTGLSESWLFKEIGDCHWHMLCKDLGLKSTEIFDEYNNRLYATFIRIKFESSSSLKQYLENDILDISGTIQRFGGSLYFGQVAVASNGKIINCSLATTFSMIEGNNNTRLTRGVPAGCEDDVIQRVSELPAHVLDIIKIKKGTKHSVVVDDYSFDITDDLLFTSPYKINPYTDINGVGLLYFAAYPLINDYCELAYFENSGISEKHWALASATMTRDIFYFANCNIDDAISYKLHSCQILSDDRIALQSSISRASDNTVMARIFTIKKLER